MDHADPGRAVHGSAIEEFDTDCGLFDLQCSRRAGLAFENALATERRRYLLRAYAEDSIQLFYEFMSRQSEDL